MFSRAIIGFSFGMNSTIAPLFIYEISKSKYIEYCIMAIQFWTNMGFVVPLVFEIFLPEFFKPDSSVPGYWDGLATTHVVWREMHAFIVIVPLLQFLFLLLIFKEENPIYVLHKNEVPWTASSGRSLEDNYHAGINDSFDSQQSIEKTETMLEKDTWGNLFELAERKKVIACIIMRVFQQLTGINIILNFTLFFLFHGDYRNLNLRLALTIMAILSVFVAIIPLKKFGRKHLFMTGMIVSCLCCWILFQMADRLLISNFSVPIFASNHNFASFVFITLFFVWFWMTFASTPIMYCSETLTDKGNAVVTTITWAVNTLIAAMPSLMLAILDAFDIDARFKQANSIYFFLFSGFSMLGFFMTAIWIKETKGKSQKEISEEFNHDYLNLNRSKIYEA